MFGWARVAAEEKKGTKVKSGLSRVGFIAILYGSEDLDSLVSLNVTEPPCVQDRARKT